jgi:hypothetical protein
MNYYKVKPEYDQKQRIKDHKYRIKRKPDGIFVANELYTAGELEKFYLTPSQDEWFERVTIPKNKVYWCFGCRFAMEGYEQEQQKKPKKRSKTEKTMDEYSKGCEKWEKLLAICNK